MNREQLKTIFWLRWCLMRNQWRRTGGLGAVLAILVGASAIMLSVMTFAGALLGAIFGLGKETSPQVIMFVWLGVTVAFLILWTIGLLTELQRSETIDLQKLMHLPVALGQMFSVNYFVSHFSFSIIIMVPAMLGLAIGLTIGHGPAVLLMIPLALSMVLMITAWTYCLRGWLSTLMTNPRRRRTVIMCITMAFVLLAQGPNLYFNVVMRFNSPGGATAEERQKQRSAQNATNRKNFQDLVASQKFIPPFWVSVGAKNLAEGDVLPALLGTLGCAAIGALGLRRAYVSTIRFYHGETGGNAPIKINNPGEPRRISAPRDKNKIDFLERSLPFVPEQSAALALSTFRSLLRAPEVKMAWATTIIVTIVLGVSIFSRGASAFMMPDVAKPFAATGAIIFSIFFLIQFFTNFFGFDRDGFRALILSPADRRLILLGKNLAVLPVGIVFGGLFFTLVAIRLHPSVETILATLWQLGSVLLIAGIGGNLLSILVPYRIQPGSMKPTKMPGLATLFLVVSQMLFPTVMLPVFFGPLLELLWRHWNLPAFVPVNLMFSAAFFFLMIFIYWIALRQLGGLLQRRETKILRVITVEVE